jgi:hypothetical protein
MDLTAGRNRRPLGFSPSRHRPLYKSGHAVTSWGDENVLKYMDHGYAQVGCARCSFGQVIDDYMAMAEPRQVGRAARTDHVRSDHDGIGELVHKAAFGFRPRPGAAIRSIRGSLRPGGSVRARNEGGAFLTGM